MPQIVGTIKVARAALDRADDLVGDVLVNIEALLGHGGSPLRAARLRPRGAKGTGTIEPRDQTPRHLSKAGGAPRSGAELHKQSAEASRVDPEAGPVILAHMRGRLRTVVAGEAS